MPTFANNSGLSNDLSLAIHALKATLTEEYFQTPKEMWSFSEQQYTEESCGSIDFSKSNQLDAFARQDSLNSIGSESNTSVATSSPLPYGMEDHQTKAYESLEKFSESPQTSSDNLTRQTFSDWRPNPSKLVEIKTNLKELKTTLSELKKSQSTSKHKQSKKELSLRICRLKSKEAHEENKIKLRGLTIESARLKYYIKKMKSCSNNMSFKEKEYLKQKVEGTLRDRVAGNLDAFIGDVLKLTKNGQNK